MIRHIVTFAFEDGVSDDARDALLRELDTFPSHFPAMRNWASGRNIIQRDTTYSHAFVVEFESEAELVAYLSSERHEAFVTERWRPIIARRAITSFEYEPSP